MPRHRSWLAAVLLLLACASPTLAAGDAARVDGPSLSAAKNRDTKSVPKRDYIVVFRDSADVTAKVSGFAHSLAVRASHSYRHIFKGFAAGLTASQLQKVAADPSVAYVLPDRAVRVEAQIVPTGIARVGAAGNDTPGSDSVLSPVDADIAIVDTGLQPDHPDLNVVGGYSCVNPNPRYWGDVYGHGTHVAGTAAALDNGIGVVGVAPGARLWSVKVFDDWGNGRISQYACGLEWVASQRDPQDPSRPLIEVANMSLRTVGSNDNNCGYTNRDPLHRAICRAVSGGTTVVVAAGNDHTNAGWWVPASYPEVITVSALADFNGAPGGGAPSTCGSWGSADSDDTFANFSNYGWPIDMMASGKCIYSTYPGNRYKVMSGTSMATPAVAGGVAIWKALHPEATPAQVKAVLRAAGRYDWFWTTDPDPYHERMLNVSSFGKGESFGLDFSSGPQAFGGTGGMAKYQLQLTRNDGFAGQVDLSASGLPDGGAAGFSPISLSGLTGLSSTVSILVPAGLPEGTYSPVITGTSGSEVHSDTVRVIIDRTPPSTSSPRVRLAGGQMGRYSTPVVISWFATDPRGIGGYEIQQSIDGGAFTRFAFSSGSVRSTVRALAMGHQYRFRVRARDRVGNLSPWVNGQTFDLVRLEQWSPAIQYRGSWRAVRDWRASSGGYRTTNQFAATATVTFTGSQVAWIAATGPTVGYARVYLDGEYVRSLTLYRGGTTTYRRIVFSGTFATTGTHTLKIWVRAPARHPRIDVDAFVVLR